MPKPPADSWAPPPHLNAVARAHWHEVLADPAVRRALRPDDRPLLALYCDAYARWCQAREQLDHMGLIVKGADGKPIPNPYLAIADACAKELRLLLGELTLTPAARRRGKPAEDVRAPGLAGLRIMIPDDRRH